MTELYEKSVRTLELPAVLGLLSREAVSAPAKEKARVLCPADSAYEAGRRLSETSAAKALLALRGSPAFGGVKDVRPSLSRADIGGLLNTRELLDVAGVLQAARTVRAYASGETGGGNGIAFLFSALTANKYLEEKITACIVDEDEIADTASPELATIRRLIRAAAARVRETLQKIISSPAYAKALQEPIIVTRSQRYVVPVRADHKGSVPGLVHDVSSSGATLFIEPAAAVKANNELRELYAREKREIERILMALSAECGAHAADIIRDLGILIELDGIFARAKLSCRLDCREPVISEGRVSLKNARHPLLPKDTAVPVTIELGGAYGTLVITGPNTGGKTVSLKTLGLLCVMAACGLHIPAADGSCVPVFRGVLADIGDEQSIEQSLSTFSSHMTTIVRILEACDDRSLVLFDELGAGTDPVEGAALAVAVIEDARKKGAMIAATTHYAELKVYATTAPGVQNASCEFDVTSLRPTYRLLIGVPGKSNAFAISERLGLPPRVIDDARGRIDQGRASFEETIEKLEKQRQLLEKDREEAEKKLRDAGEAAKRAELLRRELAVRLEKADEKARRDAGRILEDAKKTAERTFDELDRMRQRQVKAHDHLRENEARAELRRSLNETAGRLAERAEKQAESKKSARPVKAGDVVEILSMGVRARVLAVSGDRQLTLQAGILRTNAREDEVCLIENGDPADQKPAFRESAVALRREAASAELDLRGMMTDEAVTVLERYLDTAVMAKLEKVTVIHGKGTGALRAAVQQSLKTNRAVKSFRLGRYGEGETGVTVVELR
ncbi:MAG: endonuclease MutS2 [Oscillospiraceae bacterium]|jgi:DNA mismatch repair protein MutS2|nr:endonuclease MutS2 [Oscillospiraceae bacterium]